jgi:hypothetical protein
LLCLYDPGQEPHEGGQIVEFHLTDEQRDSHKAVRDFVKGEFKRDVVDELQERHE